MPRPIVSGWLGCILLGLSWLGAMLVASTAMDVVVGASMVLALFVFPNIVPSPAPPLPESFLTIFMLYIKEMFYGLFIGFGVAILFYGLEAAGAMIDNQRGVSIARVLIPQLAEQSSISGMFLFQLAIVLYVTMGGHRLFFNSFFMGFATLPVLGFPSSGPGLLPMMDLFIKITGEVLLISIQLAAPIIIAIFVADIILGIANRVAPQINVWELGFNVKGYIGVLLLFFAITLIGDQIVHYSLKSGKYADKVIGHLEGKAVVEEPALPSNEDLQREQIEIPQVINP